MNSSPELDEVVRTSNRRKANRQTASVLYTALVLRLWVVLAVALTYPKDWLYTRGMEMGLLATSILNGHGLSSPFGGNTGPTALIAPGYPLLVAAVFKLLGSYSFKAAIALMMLQVGVNLLTIWLVMRIARELFEQRTSLLAGWISACSLPLLWMPTILWDTSISACALMGVATLALKLQRHGSKKLWAGAGAYCAGVGLINPALLPAMIAILSIIIRRAPRKLARRALLAASVFVLIFGVWPARNALVLHAFVPMRTTVGFELWMGNHPGSSGFLNESLFPTFNAHELADYKQAGEIAYTRHKATLAETYIRQHPLIFIDLTGKRVLRFWFGSGTQHGSALFIVHATFTSVSGVIGLSLLLLNRRLRMNLWIFTPLLLFPIPYYLTHAEFRYRLVIDPFVTILAAYGCLELSIRARTLVAKRGEATDPRATIELAHG